MDDFGAGDSQTAMRREIGMRVRGETEDILYRKPDDWDTGKLHGKIVSIQLDLFDALWLMGLAARERNHRQRMRMQCPNNHPSVLSVRNKSMRWARISTTIFQQLRQQVRVRMGG